MWLGQVVVIVVIMRVCMCVGGLQEGTGKPHLLIFMIEGEKTLLLLPSHSPPSSYVEQRESPFGSHFGYQAPLWAGGFGNIYIHLLFLTREVIPRSRGLCWNSPSLPPWLFAPWERLEAGSLGLREKAKVNLLSRIMKGTWARESAKTGGTVWGWLQFLLLKTWDFQGNKSPSCPMAQGLEQMLSSLHASVSLAVKWVSGNEIETKILFSVCRLRI